MKSSVLKAMLVAGAAALSLSGAARAATIHRTFDVNASDFIHTFGFDPTPPPDPVHLNFTLVFDDSADVATTTTGLTINSFDLPYSAEFQYVAGVDGLTLATDIVGLGSCSSDAGTFCLFMHGVTSASPDVVYFQNSLPTYNVWQADTLSVTYTDLRIGDIGGGPNDGVPEPAAWALMLAGFGVSGAMLRARRRTLAAA